MQNYNVGANEIGKVKDIQHDTSKRLSSDFSVEQSSEPSVLYDTTEKYSKDVVEEYDVIDVPEGCELYKANSDDTFASIAEKYNLSEDELWELNIGFLNDRDITANDNIIVPIKNSNQDKGSNSMGGGGSSGGGSGENNNISSAGGSSSSNNIPSNDSNNDVSSDSSSQYSESTNDLRDVNLDDFNNILNMYSSNLQSLLSKYGYTAAEFSEIYNFVEEYAKENGIPFETDSEKVEALDKYIKEHEEYEDIDYEDLEEIVLSYGVVKEAEEYGYTTSNEGLDSVYYDEIINKLLLELGYKESEIDEFSTIDIIKMLTEDKDKTLSLLNGLMSLPEDYPLEDLLSTYAINHYIGLIPKEENADYEEVFESYQKEAIDILSQLGYDTEKLYEKDGYQLLKLLEENEDKINKLFTDKLPNIFDDNYGFDYLFTKAMDSVAFETAGKSRENLENYIEAKGFSDKVKNESLDYYDGGNIVSALYTLKVEDTRKQIKEYENRIDQIMGELAELYYDSPLGEASDLYSFADRVIEVYGESELTNRAKELLEELDICKANRDELASQVDQMNTTIIESSFEYLDGIRESDEYKDIINNPDGIVTYNNATLDNILNAIENGNMVNLKDLIDFGLTSDLTVIEQQVRSEARDYVDNIDELKQLITSFSINSTVESVTKEDNKIIVTVVKDGTTVKMIYDLDTDSLNYDFSNGATLNNYNGVNYFELFNSLMEQDEYKSMSKEEMLESAFGYIDSNMSEYNESFTLAQLAYLYLTEDEINDYMYLYKAEGQDRAEKYLESKRNKIHQRMGMRAAENDIKYIMDGNDIFDTGLSGLDAFANFLVNGTKKRRTALVGLENGVQGWEDNVYAFLTSDTTMTPTEYESKFLLDLFTSYSKKIDLSKVRITDEQLKKIDDILEPTYLDYYYAIGDITEEQYENIKSNEKYQEFYNYTNEHPYAFNYSYNIGQNVGNMLPSIMASYLVAPLGGVSIAGHFLGAGQAVAGMTLFAGAYGGEYKDKIRSGYDEITSRTYAMLSALSEVTTEYFLGRIPGVGRISETTNPVIAKNIKQLLAMRGINILKDVGGELLEESLQVLIGYALDKGVLGKDIDLSKWPKEELDTIIVTTFTTLILGLPTNASNLINDVSNGPTIKISDSESVHLTFKQIYELNQKYVNSETGQVDIEGLSIEINKMLGRTDDTSIETQSVVANPDIDVDSFISEHAVDVSDTQISRWMSDELASDVASTYGLDTTGVDPSESIVFLSGEDFQRLFNSNVSGTVVNGKAIINLDSFNSMPFIANHSKNGLSVEQIQELYLEDVVYHEFLHLVSNNETNSGLNEAMIEYMTAHRSGNSIYQETGLYTSGYSYGVKALEDLVSNTDLTSQDIVNAYSNNDMSIIENALRDSGYSDENISNILKLINTAAIAQNENTRNNAYRFIRDIIDGKEVNIPDAYLEDIGMVDMNSTNQSITETKKIDKLYEYKKDLKKLMERIIANDETMDDYELAILELEEEYKDLGIQLPYCDDVANILAYYGSVDKALTSIEEEVSEIEKLISSIEEASDISSDEGLNLEASDDVLSKDSIEKISDLINSIRDMLSDKNDAASYYDDIIAKLEEVKNLPGIEDSSILKEIKKLEGLLSEYEKIEGLSEEITTSNKIDSKIDEIFDDLDKIDTEYTSQKGDFVDKFFDSFRSNNKAAWKKLNSSMDISKLEAIIASFINDNNISCASIENLLITYTEMLSKPETLININDLLNYYGDTTTIDIYERLENIAKDIINNNLTCVSGSDWLSLIANNIKNDANFVGLCNSSFTNVFNKSGNTDIANNLDDAIMAALSNPEKINIRVFDSNIMKELFNIITGSTDSLSAVRSNPTGVEAITLKPIIDSIIDSMTSYSKDYARSNIDGYGTGNNLTDADFDNNDIIRHLWVIERANSTSSTSQVIGGHVYSPILEYYLAINDWHYANDRSGTTNSLLDGGNNPVTNIGRDGNLHSVVKSLFSRGNMSQAVMIKHIVELMSEAKSKVLSDASVTAQYNSRTGEYTKTGTYEKDGVTYFVVLTSVDNITYTYKTFYPRD